MLLLTTLYLTVMQRMQDFMEDQSGNEQTGMLLNIVITVVIAGLVLTAVRSFFPTLWDSVTRQIMDLFGSVGTP